MHDKNSLSAERAGGVGYKNILQMDTNWDFNFHPKTSNMRSKQLNGATLAPPAPSLSSGSHTCKTFSFFYNIVLFLSIIMLIWNQFVPLTHRCSNVLDPGAAEAAACIFFSF